ncbi:ubiquitin-conjugating enzyme/RWD-like protein, partial [Dunaliella salina]
LYAGGIFSLRLSFADTYPAKPPKVRFVTEIFHPNVYTDGSLCLDIIQDAWSPIHTVSTLLTSIQSLLTDPNTASPANPEAAHLYNNDRAAYNKRVRKLAARSVEG